MSSYRRKSNEQQFDVKKYRRTDSLDKTEETYSPSLLQPKSPIFNNNIIKLDCSETLLRTTHKLNVENVSNTLTSYEKSSATNTLQEINMSEKSLTDIFLNQDEVDFENFNEEGEVSILCDRNNRAGRDLGIATNIRLPAQREKKLEVSNITQVFLDMETTIRSTETDQKLIEFETTLYGSAFDKSFTQTRDENFYGLPMIVRNILKEQFGIDDLYDWQKKCLSIALESSKNLIYALPTSGGKSLVAEILILRELVCLNRNALLILPYNAIVQEKIARLSPLAVGLQFILEEYAGGKGKCPPRKRRKKQSLYIATIEKGLAMLNSLAIENRLTEIGLIVIDELHLMGYKERGSKIEALVSRMMQVAPYIRIVGMSATIGNLEQICKFLHADLYTGDFRPVELEEYIVCEGFYAPLSLCKSKSQDFYKVAKEIPKKIGDKVYDKQMFQYDSDYLSSTVVEVIPEDSCIVFCATKKNSEAVALNTARLIHKAGEFGPEKKILEHRQKEKRILFEAMDAEGAICSVLRITLHYGIAYHHSGLTGEERRLIEEGFRTGVLSVICSTSTLAAGVNLPARRVIIRSPYTGLEFIRTSIYKQMVGRAGRAGLSERGESFIFCRRDQLNQVIELANAKMDEIESQLYKQNDYLCNYLLSSVVLGFADSEESLLQVTKGTLFGLQADEETVKNETRKSLIILVEKKAVTHNLDTGKLTPTSIGVSAVKAALSVDQAIKTYEEIKKMQRKLVLSDILQLLFLVLPDELEQEFVIPREVNFLNIYYELSDDGLKAAENCGVNQAAANNYTCYNKRVPFARLFRAMALREIWMGKSVPEISEKYGISRGVLNTLMHTGATNATRLIRFCEPYPEFWPLTTMMPTIAQRLRTCASYELHDLLELPAVKQARARQLFDAGFKNLTDLSKATPEQLILTVEKISKRQAVQIISAAKALLIEKLDSIREIAEDVMQGNVKPEDLQLLKLVI